MLRGESLSKRQAFERHQELVNKGYSGLNLEQEKGRGDQG